MQEFPDTQWTQRGEFGKTQDTLQPKCKPSGISCCRGSETAESNGGTLEFKSWVAICVERSYTIVHAIKLGLARNFNESSFTANTVCSTMELRRCGRITARIAHQVRRYISKIENSKDLQVPFYRSYYTNIPHLSSMASPLRPLQTCLYCRKQKRRCDKQVPHCGTCRRAGRECEYIVDRNEELIRLRTRVAHLEATLRRDVSSNSSGSPSTPGSLDTSRPAMQPPDILAFTQETQALSFSEPVPSPLLPISYFLDTAVECRLLDVRTFPFTAIPQELLCLIESPSAIREIADSYFDTIHSWLPIVWQRKIGQFIAPVDMHPDPGMAALLAAMKMITSAAGSPSGNQLYRIVKGYLTVLEDSGFLTLGVLQAAILITLYEIGHGIYPAAYMSIGRCARVGQVMGLHGNSSTSKSFKLPTSWAEAEEIRRTWFAVLILDR